MCSVLGAKCRMKMAIEIQATIALLCNLRLAVAIQVLASIYEISH